MQLAHHPEAGGALAEILADLVDRRRLRLSQIEVGRAFLADLQSRHGRSGGLVSATSERVDTSLNVARMSSWTRAHERCQRALDSLRPTERTVLAWCIKRREHARPDLAELGKLVSTYTNRDSLVAAAATAVGMMLDSLAHVYLPESHRRAA